MDWSLTKHLRIGRQDSVKGIQHKEVGVHSICLLHVYYSMYFYDVLLVVTYLLSLYKPHHLLMCFSRSVILWISAELLYICQTVNWEVDSQLGNYWPHGVTCWPYQNRQLPWDPIMLYQMELSISATHLDGEKSKSEVVFYVLYSGIPIVYTFTPFLSTLICSTAITSLPTSWCAIFYNVCSS